MTEPRVPFSGLVLSLALFIVSCAADVDGHDAPLRDAVRDGSDANAASGSCVVDVGPSPRAGVDDTPALQAAIDEAISRKVPCTVRLEPGVYDLRSANPGAAAVDRRALTIARADGLTVAGDGATLRLASELEWQFAKTLVIVRSSNVTVRGLTFEWSTPGAVTARVTAVGDTWVEFAPAEGFGVPDPGPDRRLVRRMWRLTGPSRLMDPTSPATFNPTKFPWTTTVHGDRFRVHPPEPYLSRLSAVTVGDDYAVFRSLYTFDTMHFVGVDGMRVEDVTIHSVGGMGIWGDRSEDIHIAGLRMVPSPDLPAQAFTATTDGVHLVHNRGAVDIVDSAIMRTGDDAISVSNLMMVITAISPDRRAVRVRFEARAFPPVIGDQLNPFDLEGRTYDRAPVIVATESTRVDDGWRIELDRPLADAIEPGFGLVNTTWQPAALRINDNYVYGVRGRGVLLHAQDTEVRGNVFRAITGPGVLMLHRRYVDKYYPGPMAQRIDVRQNEFQNTPRHGSWGAVTILSQYADGTPVEVAGVHRHLFVRNNVFTGTRMPAILARNAFDLWIQQNEFRNVSGSPTVSLDTSHEVYAHNNCYGVISAAGCRTIGKGTFSVGSGVTGLRSGGNVGFAF